MTDFRPFELVATEETRGIAGVATIHDTDDRSFDVVCSRHWWIYSHGYRENASRGDIFRARHAAALRAAEHATECEVTS